MVSRAGRVTPPSANRWRRCVAIGFVVFLCCCFFELGAWQMGGAKGDNIHRDLLRLIATCSSSALTLEFESHGQSGGVVRLDTSDPFPSCHPQLLRPHSCLVPTPAGYLYPFPWPMSREFVPSSNVDATTATLAVYSDGDVLRFPAGGVESYIDDLASVIPFHDGSVRTALDVSSGIATFGAYLLERDVLVMSLAQEAEVQIALERGLPAVVGDLGSTRLPYPSGSFDMVHCSRCHIHWSSNDGMYMMEVDRILRPGGYWVFSGVPVDWKTDHEIGERLEEEHLKQYGIEGIAKLLCWERDYEEGGIMVWRKNINSALCTRKGATWGSVEFCGPSGVADIWHKNLTACRAPYPKVSSSGELPGGQLKKFPKRLFAVPPSVVRGQVPGITQKIYQADSKLWKKYVATYKKLNKFLGTTRYRNIMDMNAGLGGFASVLESPNSWVMNVVPAIPKKDTLGIIYERGLIGIYHDWCEAFPTYPRTYDLIHASGVFNLYKDKCKMEDILLEMDRVLRPEGTVIFRDDVDVIVQVKNVTSGMRWDTKISDTEDGPLSRKKILMAVKRYWVARATNSSSTSS